MKKISVIIPAYNAENTIERCISSVQNQDYNNLEIIVVNDGSTDKTPDLVKIMMKADSRIRLVSISNSGVSHARNIGIDNATGDYISFVDSDDFIDSKMYSSLYDIIVKYNVKIAHCSYKNVDEKGRIISVVGDKGREVKQSHDEAMQCLLSGKLFIGGLCNKLYEKSLFSDIRLNEKIRYNEDILANYYLFDKINDSIYIDNAYYNYVATSSSATHSANSVCSGEQILFVSKEMYKHSIGHIYENTSKERVATSMLNLCRAYIFSTNENEKKKRKPLLQEIKKIKKQGFYNNKKDKLLIFMYSYTPCFFRSFFRFYDRIRVKKLDPEQ